MSESSIGLNVDGAGKKVRTLKRTIGADEVHEEVHNVTDGAGTIVDPRKNVEVTGVVVVGSSALPVGAATETTLALLKARADLLATEVTLALIKARTDNLDVALSTRALETGGNLAAIAGKDFATQTTLASILAQFDNKTSTLATQTTLASILAQLDNKTSTLASQVTLALVLAQLDNKTSTLSTEATLAALSAKITACNTGAIAGSLTQSTKHDSKVYASAVFDAAASGNLVAAVANKVTKLHALAIQAQGTVVVNLNDGVAGTSLMEWSFQAREGAVLPLASAPAFWAKTTANTILYVTLSAAVQVTITAIVSSDDAS